MAQLWSLDFSPQNGHLGLDTEFRFWYTVGMDPGTAPLAALLDSALPTGLVLQRQTPAKRVRPCAYCPLAAENVELRQQARYWESMFKRAREREERLQGEIEQQKARIKELERQLFGRKSEKGRSRPRGASGSDKARGSQGKRGQRPGQPGPGRRDTSQLRAKDEIRELCEQECQCPLCGLPYEEDGSLGTEDSELIEIEVRAHKRRIHRKRYRPKCQCPLPKIITAPGPPKLIPKGRYGISLWVHILLDKFCFLRPTNRLLGDLRTYGVDLSLGTVTGGLKKLVPAFEPIMDEIIRKNLEERQWHADETGWPIFVSLPELTRLLENGQLSPGCEASDLKPGGKWKLWLFQSRSAVVFRLDPTRKARVPEGYFHNVEGGVLIVDRYVAYKAMVQVKEGRILLAFCWAHVRRDFLDLSRNFSGHEEWGLSWVEAIGEIGHLNDLRLQVWKTSREQFASRDQVLRAALKRMELRRDAELSDSNLQPLRRKVLKSLKNHWGGLTLFVDHPEIPMTNNQAERTHRKPVCGRKQFYGSYALWAGQLAAMLFSLFATLQLSGINPRTWLTAYLEACAEAGGKAPADASRFLPWNLSAKERAAWSEPPLNDSS